jgi:predicted kinase
MPEPTRGEIGAIWTTIADGWKSLPAQARAWVLAVLPKDTPAMAPLLDAARADQSPEVLTTWLISRVVDPTDPMLDVGRRSGDPTLAMFADATAWVLNRRAKRAVEEVGLEAGATPAP